MNSLLLEVKDLGLEIETGADRLRLLDGIGLCLERGETLGLVGESGSGKSLTAQCLTRLIPSPPAHYFGEVRFAGADVMAMSSSELRRLRGGGIGYIFQEPAAALNPVMRIGTQILESLKLHDRPRASTEEVVRLLKLVGLPSPDQRARQYPHELSGGMQQRAVIAMALAARPELLVADEPTTALDVTIQAQIVELLRELQKEFGMAIVLITHNLDLVAELANRVAVMYAGQIVESGPVDDVLRNPSHPYTRALLASSPRLDGTADRLTAINGQVPSPRDYPSGCRFHPRCDQVRDECKSTRPKLESPLPGREVRCPFHLT